MVKRNSSFPLNVPLYSFDLSAEREWRRARYLSARNILATICGNLFIGNVTSWAERKGAHPWYITMSRSRPLNNFLYSEENACAIIFMTACFLIPFQGPSYLHDRLSLLSSFTIRLFNAAILIDFVLQH